MHACVQREGRALHREAGGGAADDGGQARALLRRLIGRGAGAPAADGLSPGSIRRRRLRALLQAAGLQRLLRLWRRQVRRRVAPRARPCIMPELCPRCHQVLQSKMHVWVLPILEGYAQSVHAPAGPAGTRPSPQQHQLCWQPGVGSSPACHRSTPGACPMTISYHSCTQVLAQQGQHAQMIAYSQCSKPRLTPLPPHVHSAGCSRAMPFKHDGIPAQACECGS